MHGEEDYVLPFGPQHPALAEPVLLNLKLDGEKVISAEARFGYMHRGIEKMLEGKTPEKGIMICERICGICPVSHSTCYTLAVENAADEPINNKIAYERMILAELERMHSHLVCVGLQMHDMGFDTLFMFLWRERERILDIFEKITGGRVQHSSNRIASVNFDISGIENYIINEMNEIKKNIARYKQEYSGNDVLHERTRNIGTISKKDAEKLHLVGPIARASGVGQDIRTREPYLKYNEFDYQPIVFDMGDVYERTFLRIEEIFSSAELVKKIVEKTPDTKIFTSKICKTISEDCQGIQRVEAPRGELFYFVEIKNNLINRCRMRPPTYAYIQALEPLLTDCKLGDVPMIVSSIDPCFACLDRVMLESQNEKRLLKKNEFKRLCGVHTHD